MVLKSLKSLEGESCKGYLAHFKLRLFFATCLLLAFSKSGCLMDCGHMNVLSLQVRCVWVRGIKYAIKDLVYGDAKALCLLECL